MKRHLLLLVVAVLSLTIGCNSSGISQINTTTTLSAPAVTESLLPLLTIEATEPPTSATFTPRPVTTTILPPTMMSSVPSPTPSNYFSNTDELVCCKTDGLTLSELRLVAILRNSTYQSNSGEKYPLHDGVSFYNCEEVSPAIPCYTYVIEPVAFGDLDGDGLEDAAIILQSWGGGSALAYEVAVVLRQGNGFAVTPAAYIANKPKIQEITIEPHRVVISLTLSVADFDYCPLDENGKMVFRFDAGKLICAGQN